MDIIKLVSGYEASIEEIESMLKEENSIKYIIDYINHTIIPNACIQDNIDPNNDTPINFSEIRELFIGEITQIIKKLSLIIKKYITTKPGQFVNLDMENPWFHGDPTFIIDKECIYQSLFIERGKISQILTIICKLIDYINNTFITEIDLYNRKIKYCEMKISESTNVFQYRLLISDLTRQKTVCIEKFGEVHSISDIAHKYILSIFRTNNKGYLSFMPKSIMNIFSSSLYFLENDCAFLEFIVEFASWIPSDYRCNYISRIIKLFNEKSFERILSKFNPNINLLIDDICVMYKQYLKDPSVIENIVIIINLLSSIMIRTKVNLLDSGNGHIYFISVILTIISKIKSEKEHIPIDNYYVIIINCITCIEYIIKYNRSIIDSYLVHFMSNILLDLELNENI